VICLTVVASGGDRRSDAGGQRAVLIRGAVGSYLRGGHDVAICCRQFTTVVLSFPRVRGRRWVGGGLGCAVRGHGIACPAKEIVLCGAGVVWGFVVGRGGVGAGTRLGRVLAA